MATTCTLSNHFKFAKCKKMIDLSADSIKVLLMRSGFTFNKDLHAIKDNIKGTIERSDISFEASTKHIHTAAGDFEDAGFVAGGQILVSGSAGNDGIKTIVSVDTPNQMTVSETLVNETVGEEIIIDGNDELATGNGYVQDAMVLTGQALAEDDSANQAVMTCDDPGWTAEDGALGPTPGAIVVDETASDKTIIGYIDFGGEVTVDEGLTLTIEDLQIIEN